MSAPAHAPPLEELTHRLRRRERRVTAPRQAILEFLRRQTHPASRKEIFSALPRGVGDLATVYRSVQLLESMGMVQRFDFGDGVARYRLLAEGEDGHRHHLICRQCRTVVEVRECFAADLERQIARRNGYRAVSHRLEFFGLCPQCQGAEP